MEIAEREHVRLLLASGDESVSEAIAGLSLEGTTLETVDADADGSLDSLEGVDLVVSTLDLPDGDGLDLLRSIRDRRPHLPFILVPASGDESTAGEAIAAGVTEYVPRDEGTVPRGDLEAAIRRAIDGTDLEQRMAEMERVHAVLKEVDAALVRADTRSEIESAVCSILADSESYTFAWIGEYDPDAHSLTPKATAGEGGEFLESIPVGENQELPDEGPGPNALETNEVQVTQNVENDEAFDPYREEVDSLGFRSVATVPLSHEGERFGLLAIYANRAHAFDEREQDLLASLGDDIGYALNAVEAAAELRRFRKAVDHAGHAISVTSEDGRIEYANPTFEEQTGYPPEEVVGRKLSAIQNVDPKHSNLDGGIDQGTSWDREFLAERRSGESYHAEQTIAPITDTEGNLDGFVVVQADVSDRKERERALRTETEMLEGLLETSPIGIVVLSPDGTIQRANDRAASLLSQPADALIGRTFDDEAWAFYDGDGDRLVGKEHPFHRVARRNEAVYDYEVRLDAAADEPIWLSINGAPLSDPGGETERLVFTFDDVTDRKRREADLRSFKQAVEHAAHCIYMTDVDGVIEYVNPAFENQTGYSREEAIGETPDILNSGVHDESFFEDLWETILAGEVWEHEIVNERRDGTHVDVDQSIAPVLDEDGEVERFVAINQDITERKEYERQLERQNERLEEFASVVSHDLRNPLNVAVGHLELLEEHDEHHEAIAESLDRMQAIIEDVLTLARDSQSVEHTEAVDLGAVAESAFGHVASERATLEVVDAPTIQADGDRLARILENLFRNAVEHALPEDPDVDTTLTIRVGATGRGFYVEDDGRGIPDAKREQVFESGYTESESGTGLGLAIIRRLANAHGWGVSLVDGTLGGARFTFEGVEFTPDSAANEDGPAA